MVGKDIFAGPIIRRAQPERVAIWLAARKKLHLAFRIRSVGTSEWLGQTTELTTFKVFEGLFVSEVFDQWAEVLPTDQLVPVEVKYNPKTGRQV